MPSQYRVVDRLLMLIHKMFLVGQADLLHRNFEKEGKINFDHVNLHVPYPPLHFTAFNGH
jgi:hypothetical protein